jgi:hypothetical protein
MLPQKAANAATQRAAQYTEAAVPRQRSDKKTRPARQDPLAVAVQGPAHKRFLHNDVSGKDTHSCSEAAFMHALLKLQSRKYAR